MAEATLDFLARQQEPILDELRSLRGDRTVLTGIALRLEGGVQGLTVEMRGLRSHVERQGRGLRDLPDCVQRLEDIAPAT